MLILLIMLILISIIIIAYNLIEDLNSLLPMTEPQYRFWNSMHVVIRKLLHFALLHYALEKLLQFALKDYYILRWKFITFCVNVITFCASITFCVDSYYILR